MTYFVGLGNAYKKYIGTRHNIGMDLLEELPYEKTFKLEHTTKGENYTLRKFSYLDETFYTIRLQTYMNLSGVALKSVCDKKNISLDEICVISDDFNLPYGRFRIRLSGSSGSHKGLQSIINTFGRNDFARIRVGLGPLLGIAEEFVLQRFTKEEMSKIPRIYITLVNIIEEIVQNGYEKAMNRFNNEH